MSRYHLASKNIDWPNMLNLLCFNTQKPQYLSKKQKVTRLYKTYLRFMYNTTLVESNMGREKRRLDHQRAKSEFEEMLSLPQNSVRSKNLFDKYRKYVEDNYDITYLAFDNQSHSANSQKLWLFTDEQLSYDPFGYYVPKTTNYTEKSFAVPFYEDFPYDGNRWQSRKRFLTYDTSFAGEEKLKEHIGPESYSNEQKESNPLNDVIDYAEEQAKAKLKSASNYLNSSDLLNKNKKD